MHYSLFIIHCPLFIIHYSLFIIHYSLFIIHYSLFIIHCSLYIVHRPLYINCRAAHHTALRRSSSSTPAGFFYAARLSAFPFGIFCGLLVLKKFRPLNPHCMRTKKSSSVSRALDARLPSPFFHCRAIGLPALLCTLYIVLFCPPDVNQRSVCSESREF